MISLIISGLEQKASLSGFMGATHANLYIIPLSLVMVLSIVQNYFKLNFNVWAFSLAQPVIIYIIAAIH